MLGVAFAVTSPLYKTPKTLAKTKVTLEGEKVRGMVDGACSLLAMSISVTCSQLYMTR